MCSLPSVSGCVLCVMRMLTHMSYYVRMLVCSLSICGFWGLIFNKDC